MRFRAIVAVAEQVVWLANQSLVTFGTVEADGVSNAAATLNLCCATQRSGGALSQAEARSILVGLGPALPPPTMAGLEQLKTAVAQIMPQVFSTTRLFTPSTTSQEQKVLLLAVLVHSMHSMCYTHERRAASPHGLSGTPR